MDLPLPRTAFSFSSWAGRKARPRRTSIERLSTLQHKNILPKWLRQVCRVCLRDEDLGCNFSAAFLPVTYTSGSSFYSTALKSSLRTKKSQEARSRYEEVLIRRSLMHAAALSPGTRLYARCHFWNQAAKWTVRIGRAKPSASLTAVMSPVPNRTVCRGATSSRRSCDGGRCQTARGLLPGGLHHHGAENSADSCP